MRPDRESDPVDDVFLGRICGVVFYHGKLTYHPPLTYETLKNTGFISGQTVRETNGFE